MSTAMKGRTPKSAFKKGHSVSEQTRRKISDSLRGHIVAKTTREKISKKNTGRKPTAQERAKISEGLKRAYAMEPRSPVTETIKEKIRATMKAKGIQPKTCHIGHAAWNKGLPPERQSGWRGGISFEPYSVAFTDNFKESIRQRDDYTCQLCKAAHESIGFPIHHIDYDKKNSNPGNLITLCPSCHGKTNSHRSFWQEYLRGMMESKMKA